MILGNQFCIWIIILTDSFAPTAKIKIKRNSTSNFISLNIYFTFALKIHTCISFLKVFIKRIFEEKHYADTSYARKLPNEMNFNSSIVFQMFRHFIYFSSLIFFFCVLFTSIQHFEKIYIKILQVKFEAL